MQPDSAISSQPCAADIERVFNSTVGYSYNTVLVGGAAEPFYRPASQEHPQHCIFYREDFVASSLHEVAHWLVAGSARRLLPDWGYWYAPDGRDAGQQRQFEQVEARPQALEWLLHIACGLRFRVSLDNLGADGGDGAVFRDRVHEQACRYLRDGVNARTVQLYMALATAFGGPTDISALRLFRVSLD